MAEATSFVGKGLAIGAGKATPRPIGKCAPAETIIEASRNAYFKTPGQSLLPAGLLQIICNRGEHVRHTPPDIRFAVTIEVDGVAQKARRQKLRLPHGTSPRTDKLPARDMTVLQYSQRAQQFVAE